MDLNRLAGAWPVPCPWTLRNIDSGANNLTRIVDTPAGAYVLRVYENDLDPNYFRYEHAVLTRLQRMDLPFAVPVPVEDHSGDTLVPVLLDGQARLAALFPFIPGRRPDPVDLAHTRAAGLALGELTRALARIGHDLGPSPQPPCGDLHGTHPLVPDPLALPAELPLDRVEQERLTRLFAELMELVPPLYDSLPWQISHGDYAHANVLMEENRVTGVLDFEFVARDLRAMDFAIGLSFFAGGSWGTPGGWQQAAAFGAGYAERVQLAPAEVAALPTLLRLREACVVIHVAGRHRQGLDPVEQVKRRVLHALWLEDWLSTQAGELVDRAWQWFTAEAPR